MIDSTELQSYHSQFDLGGMDYRFLCEDLRAGYIKW